MPAIDLFRLKIQVSVLADRFTEPSAFLASLREILEFYTDRSRRTTQVAIRTAIPTFNVPRPVLRQIMVELAPLASAQPLEAVELANALWEAGYLESRLLAAFLTGHIPPEKAMPIYGHLGKWLEESQEKELQNALLTDAFARLRRESPQVVMTLLEEWLSTSALPAQVWGLQALVPLLAEPEFENLPAIFRIIKPAIIAASPLTQTALAACLTTLARRSPLETLHFLREVIQEEDRPMMLHTLRRILPSLPPSIRETLGKEWRLKSSGDSKS